VWRVIVFVWIKCFTVIGLTGPLIGRLVEDERAGRQLVN